MNCDERSIATSDCFSFSIPHAAQMISGAIGRPQIASVSTKRRASCESAAETRIEHLGKRGLPTRLYPRSSGIAGQLLEHERTAFRFAGDAQLLNFAER